MGWSIGFDSNWNRDIGYGVPATCDHPECSAKIDRGLSYVCGGEPYGGEDGCGLYFCGEHGGGSRCKRCEQITDDGPYVVPFVAKPDNLEWIDWKLTDASWQSWRDDNPLEVAKLRALVAAVSESKEVPA